MRPRVFVISPFASRVGRTRGEHVSKALELCHAVIEAGGSPLAPHLHWPRMLDDKDEQARATGIDCGLSWGAVAQLGAVFTGYGISRGMRRESCALADAGIPVVDAETVQGFQAAVARWIRESS